MDMKNGLPGFGAGIENEAVSFFRHILFLDDFLRGKDHFPGEEPVRFRQVRNTTDMFLGNHQDV